MVIKKYSLDLSEIDESLIEIDIPKPEPISKVSDADFDIDYVCSENRKSLNLCVAFANYLVQRNQTDDLSQSLSIGKKALAARNKEQKKIKVIEVERYIQKLSVFIEKFKEELEFETKQKKEEGDVIAENIKLNAEKSRGKYEPLVMIIRQRLQRIQDLNRELDSMKDEFEKSPLQYIISNKHYFEIKEHCMNQLNKLTKYLNAFTN